MVFTKIICLDFCLGITSTSNLHYVFVYRVSEILVVCIIIMKKILILFTGYLKYKT